PCLFTSSSSAPGTRDGRPPFPTRRSSDLLARPPRQAVARRTRWLERVAAGCPARADRVVVHPSACPPRAPAAVGHGDSAHRGPRSEEHTSELQSRFDLVCRLLLEKKRTRY